MTIDEIYELIGANIYQNIEREDWTEAKLFIQGNSTYVDTNGYYLAIDKNKHIIDVHQFDDEVDFALMELHEITIEGGNNKWNRAIFTLFSTGKFDMEFIWDQELNDEIERLSKE